jgi:hypothetical protein
MLERIETAPGTIGIRLGETLTVAEIDQLYADVRAALEAHERLNYFVDATRYSRIGLEAGLHSLKMRLAHLDWYHRFRRVAVVSDSAMIRGAVAMFDLLTPLMEVKAFGSDDPAAAQAWCEAG